MTREPDDQLLLPAADLTEDTERAVVGALVLAGDQTRRTILDIVTDDDITDPRARFTLTTIRSMVGAGLPVDELTVSNYVASCALLPTGPPRIRAHTFIAEVTATAPVPMAGPYYATMAVQAAARRRIAAAGAELIRVADEGGIDELTTIAGAEFVAVAEILARAGRTAGDYE